MLQDIDQRLICFANVGEAIPPCRHPPWGRGQGVGDAGSFGPRVSTERGDQVDRSRLRVDSRKWLLSKALPKIYGDKQQVEGKFTVDWAHVAQEAADKWDKKHKS